MPRQKLHRNQEFMKIFSARQELRQIMPEMSTLQLFLTTQL